MAGRTGDDDESVESLWSRVTVFVGKQGPRKLWRTPQKMHNAPRHQALYIYAGVEQLMSFATLPPSPTHPLTPTTRAPCATTPLPSVTVYLT